MSTTTFRAGEFVIIQGPEVDQYSNADFAISRVAAPMTHIAFIDENDLITDLGGNLSPDEEMAIKWELHSAFPDRIPTKRRSAAPEQEQEEKEFQRQVGIGQTQAAAYNELLGKAKDLIRQTFENLVGQDGPVQIEPYSNVRDDELREKELYMASCHFLFANDVVDRFTIEDKYTHSYFFVTSCVSNEVLKERLEVALQQIDTEKYEEEEFEAVLALLNEKEAAEKVA